MSTKEVGSPSEIAAAGSAISLTGVWKRYGDFVAVADLSFRIPVGVVYGVLGPNGAGKSTTLRMVNDIIGPDEGEIRILGDLRPGREASRRIGYLPEERGLYPKMKIVELLQFFAELRGLSAGEGRRRALKWIDRLELSDWARHKVEDLSKGMQQKIQFITSVIHEPDLLILDEPWSGLDPINAEVLRDIVSEQRAAGKTIVFSTHLMEQAEQICDYVCIIARGRKVLDGELHTIKREAGGDRRVALRFGDDSQNKMAVETVLADAALVRGTRTEKGVVFAELSPGVDSQQLLSALNQTDLDVRRFEVYEPSLHQIFVERVGEDAATGRPRGSKSDQGVRDGA